MPELPRYQDKGTLPSTQRVGATVEPGMTSKVSEGVGELAKTVQAGTEHFAKLKMANEESQARIVAADRIAKMEDDIVQNPDSWDSQKVSDRLAEIGNEASQGMSFEVGRTDFMATYGMTKIQIQTKTNAALRTHQIGKRKEFEKLESEAIYRLPEKAREQALDTMFSTSKDVGMYESDEAVKVAKKDILDEYAIRDAVNFAQAGNITKANEFADKLTDPVMRDKVKEQIVKAAAYGRLVQEAQQQAVYTESQGILMDFLDVPNATYIEKLEKIQQMKMANQIDKQTEEIAMATLMRDNEADYYIREGDVTSALSMIEDLEGSKPNPEDIEETKKYLRKILDVQNSISIMWSEGRITMDDKKLLTTKARAAGDMYGRQKQATAILASEEGFLGLDGPYKKAAQEFEDALGLAYKDRAVRAYFYRLEGDPNSPMPKEMDRKLIRQQIIDEITTDSLNEIYNINVPQMMEVLGVSEEKLTNFAKTYYPTDFKTDPVAAKKKSLHQLSLTPKGVEMQTKYKKDQKKAEKQKYEEFVAMQGTKGKVWA